MLKVHIIFFINQCNACLKKIYYQVLLGSDMLYVQVIKLRF